MKNSQLFFICTGFALGLFLEVEAVRSWLSGLDTRMIYYWHIPAAALWSAVAAQSFPLFITSKDQKRPGLFYFVLSLSAPVIGPVLALSSFLIIRFIPRIPPPPPERYVYGDEISFRYFDDKSPEPVKNSVLDLLSSNNPQMRRQAVLSARRLSPRSVTSVMQKAMTDSDEQVRLFAVGHWQRMIGEFQKQIEDYRAEIERKPDRTAYRVALAELFHEQVFIGIASREYQNDYIETAINLLRGCLQDEPDNQNIQYLLQKFLMKAGRLEDARDLQLKLRAAGYPPELLDPWLIEISFRRKDWLEFNFLVNEMHEHAQPPLLAQVLNFWKQRHDAAKQAA